MRTPRGSIGRIVALAIGVVALATAGIAASPSPPAAAAAEHRALVIIDTGAGVTQRVVTFSEDSISGLAALQRAGADPVVYQYAGQGGAVCRLFGVGRDAGPGCLGGADGDPRYWAYWRAPAGSSTFTYSRVGAGATAVHDGDVEGWRFSTGSAPPPYAPVPPPVAPPPPPAATAPPSSGTPGAVGTAPEGPAGAPGTAPAAPGGTANGASSGAPTTATSAAGALPSTGASASGSRHARARADRADGADAPRTRTASAVHAAGSGGAPWSLIGFGVLVVAIVGAVVLVRRARRPRAPTG